MHIHADKLHKACQQLKAVAEELAQNPPRRIDYRERARIERPLFLVVKEVCLRHLGYDIHGLSEVHRKELNDWMKGKACGRSLHNFVREAFELRVFLLDLSSTNPYVQADSLSRASLTKEDAVRTLSRTLHSLAERAMKEEGEQHVGQVSSERAPSAASNESST